VKSLQTDDGGSSDGNSSHCLRQDELKSYRVWWYFS